MRRTLAFLAAAALAAGCGAGTSGAAGNRFVSRIDNPWFPLLPGTAYDYRGMRVRKAGSGALLRYVYDDESVLLQTDDFGNTLSKYDYGPDRLLAGDSARSIPNDDTPHRSLRH